MFKEWEKKKHAIVLESHEKLASFVMDAKTSRKVSCVPMCSLPHEHCNK